MSTDKVVITTGRGKDYSSKAAEVLCECFRKDPVMTWLTCTLTDQYRQEVFPDIYKPLMAAAQGGGALFYEAEDWGSCATVVPPGNRIDAPLNMIRAGVLGMLWKIGVSSVKRAIVDYEGSSDRLRNKTLGKEQTYYVFAIGTLESYRGKGLCSAQMRQIQADATKTGHAVWLEATTAASRSIYEKLGWVTIDEIKLGVGYTNADGFLQKGGEGVTIWGMLWRPEGSKEL